MVGESADMSGEAHSRATLDLPGVQQRLVQAVVAAGKKVVIVLMNGRPLTIGWMQDSVSAIVESWFLGVEHGNAVADVLFGDYNPGGKLPVTFPRLVGQVPLYYAHRNTGRPLSEGNKYMSRYVDAPGTPLYPFGFGLSYTTFAYGAPRLSAPTLRIGETLSVEVDVTNQGARAGDEVVQLYIGDQTGSVTRPVQQLRGFQRVTLQPGEARTVRFTLGAQDLAFHDVSMRRVVEAGAFRVYVGPSSVERQEARFELVVPGGGSVALPERCGGGPGSTPAR